MILVIDLFLRSSMAELQVDLHKTALVLIDLQNAIVAMNTAPHPGSPGRQGFGATRWELRRSYLLALALMLPLNG
jgi:hypothetical protein